jgi:hypothetical protein
MGMRVTGQGNTARELRVRGTDESGACGLWLLELDALAQGHGAPWRFESTGICASSPPFAPVAHAPSSRRWATLTGSMTDGGMRYTATLTEFSLVDSPVRLELRDPRGDKVVFKGLLHLVPAWSPLEIQDPGRDGRYKMLHATVEADADFVESGFATAHHLKTFDLTLYSSEDEVVLKPLADDTIMGTLVNVDGAGFPDEVAAYVFANSATKGVAGACDELRARVDADEKKLLPMVAGTPVANVVGTVTGIRFWYYHGISMIPPLGRMIDWGTRLLYDRWQMTRFERALVEKHCGS